MSESQMEANTELLGDMSEIDKEKKETEQVEAA